MPVNIMFSGFAEFKAASKLLADRLNQLENFEAELSLFQKDNTDFEFLSESELFVFIIRTALEEKEKAILTLAFRFTGDSFPETYFKACRFDNRRVLGLEELVEFLPPILFKKVELEFPRFESTSSFIACNELQGYFKMNLCGLRDDYIALTSDSLHKKTINSNSIQNGHVGFHKLASWVSWVMKFFGHGLPSKILTENISD